MKKGKATGISDAQARALGHLTINFNFLEQAVEAFISLIVSPRDLGLDKPLISHLSFARKIDVLATLIKSLSEHYVPTDSNHKAYLEFKAATERLIDRAKELNRFRNQLIHWRYSPSKEEVSLKTNVGDIEAHSAEMHDAAISLWGRALGLRTGDYSLSFGQQFASYREGIVERGRANLL